MSEYKEYNERSEYKKMNTNQKLDWIFDWTDSLMREGRFGEIDRVLETMMPEYHEIDELLGWLTATLPAKSKLPSRKQFYSDVEGALKAKGLWEPGLLKGLE
jgi:hypothetical protein